MNHNPYKDYSNPSEYHMGDDNEKQRLENIADRIAAISRPKSKGRAIWYLSLAASVILIAIVWIVKNPSPERLAQSFFKPYQNYAVEQLRGEQNDAQLLNFYKAYDAQDYHKAATVYEQSVVSKRPLDQMYYGISLVGSEDYQGGLDVLQSLEGQVPAEHRESILFYSGLALAGTGLTNQATDVFSEIIKQPASYYYDDAKKILAKIK